MLYCWLLRSQASQNRSRLPGPRLCLPLPRSPQRMRMPMPRHGHALLLLLAALLASAASAQPSDGDYGQQQVQVSKAMIALLAAVIAVFVFIASFTVYLRHCTGYAARSAAGYDGERATVPNLDAFISRSRRQRRHTPRGLDAELVEAFPTMKYAEAKALRVGGGHQQGGGGVLECAVCLSEFEDEERLRLLLPRCSHAFHPDCIGEWLASHVTCPVCRCNLDDPSHKDTSSDEDRPPAAGFVSPVPVASSISSSETAASGPLPVAVVIDVITEAEEEVRRQEALEMQQIGTQRRAMRSLPTTQLARSHSTGHSLAVVRLDRDLERFTLRLPEHVRREMVAAAAAGEHSMQLRRGRRAGGEGSSRGGRSAPLGRARAAGRWQSLLARTFSGTGKLSFFSASRRMTVSSEQLGEVSSSSSSTRARGKRVAAVDAADVPANGTGSVRLDRIGGGGGSGAASREVALAAAADEEKKAAATPRVRT